MSKKRLLVLGNSYMDFVAKVRRAPERLERVISNQEHIIMPGGFGIISAVTSSGLDTDTVLCTRLGDDETGRKLMATLEQSNVDRRFVVTDKRKESGVNAITVEDGYKARTITFPGANNSICFDDIESSFTSYPDAFMLSTEMREELVRDAIKFSNSSNVPVILSCGSEGKNFDFDNIGNVKIFLPNREATYRITGIDPVDANTALHACVKLVNSLKCEYVVIKLGQRGTFVFDGVYSQIIPVHNVETVDYTGVETIFDAALASSYLEFEDINKAAIFANAAASHSISKDGAFTSIPTLDDVKNMFDNR